MNGTEIKRTHLEYVGGTSYKEYNVIITQIGNKYNVFATYGRIGSNLVEVQKENLVNYPNALNAEDKLLRAKQKKGYDVIEQSVESRFTRSYIEGLTQRAATLTAEGGLERNHYKNLKAMLLSPDDETLTMAEKIIIENEKMPAKNVA